MSATAVGRRTCLFFAFPAHTYGATLFRRATATQRHTHVRQRLSMSSSVRPDGGENVRIALCQIPVSDDKNKNLETAQKYIKHAKSRGAAVAVLPECFNCPYDTAVFKDYAEPVPHAGTRDGFDRRKAPSIAMLQDAAREHGLFIIGGSIPEIDSHGSRIYNTSVSFSPTGEIMAKHRKVHLFDIDCSATGGIKFKESDALTAGDGATYFTCDTSLLSPAGGGQAGQTSTQLRVGVGICYDVRFPELAMTMTRKGGAHLLVFPGAFNMTTGPAHWELLARSRALDNQVYVALCSPARWDEKASYTPWGHSTIVDPWGNIVATTEHDEDLVVADISLARLKQVRQSIPTAKQRRPDVYCIESKQHV